MSENGPVRPESGSRGAGPVPKTRTRVLVIVLFVVPFLPLTTAQKIGLSSGLVVVAVSPYPCCFDPRPSFSKR